jgi:hypothetical protein
MKCKINNKMRQRASTCEFNIWTKLHKNSEVRILNVEHAMQQDASIHHNEWLVATLNCVNVHYSEAEDETTHAFTGFFPCSSASKCEY